MSRTADYRQQGSKWMREPSNGTRLVVFAAGLDIEHLDLLHHSFSCFENVALMQVEAAPPDAELFDARLPTCDYCVVVAGELDKRFLRDLPKRKISIYPIAEQAPRERSVIEAVEHVKSLARATPAPRLETDTDLCRRCP